MSSSSIQGAALVLLLVVLGVLVWALIRVRRTSSQHARRATVLEEQLRQQREAGVVREAAVYGLAWEFLPNLVEEMTQNPQSRPTGNRHPSLTDTTFGRSIDEVVRQFHLLFDAAERHAERRAEDGARAALTVVMKSVQALLRENEKAVTELVEVHHDPGLLAKATRIAHTSAQVTRRVQGINVLLGGGPPGRKWSDAPLTGVVRQAMGRIKDFDRVTLNAEPGRTVVAGKAVEPLAHTLAELLDNAARHAHARTKVDVSFIEGDNGTTVVVQDAGVGLSPELESHVGRVVAGGTPLQVTRLSRRPKFGWLVVGHFASRFGLRVTVDNNSAFGGVRVMVLIPQSLFAPAKEVEAPAPPRHARAVSAPVIAVAAQAALPTRAAVEPEGPGGLPQRVPGSARHPAGGRVVSERPQNPGATIGAFVNGSRRHRPDTSPTDEGNLPS